jgi:hypothetical protein
MAKSENARVFCQEIKRILVEVSCKTETDAIRLINELWKNQNDIESDPLLYEELPWYYAMVIAHHPVIGDNQPMWYKDSNLWPPPEKWRRW